MDTKTKILNATEDLIKQVGINATSFQKISDAVGIRKASLYHHFTNKEALISAIIQHCQNLYGNQYKSIANSNISVAEKLKAVAKVFEDGLEENRMCVVGMLSAEQANLKEETKKELQKAINNTVAIYTSIFAEGQRDKSVNCTSSPEQMAMMFFSFLEGAQLISRPLDGKNTFAPSVKAMIDSIIV